jgi:hypothetical protein
LTESTASVLGAVRSQAPKGLLLAQEPRQLLETPQQVSRRTGPGVILASRWWASKEVSDPTTPTTPIEYRTAARRPRGEEFLPSITEVVGDGGMEPEKVVELAVTVAMEPPHARGHYTHVWCVTDRDGKMWKVRLIAAAPGDRDLAANPTHPKILDGDRAFHPIDLSEDRAEDMARSKGVDVPDTVAQWGAGAVHSGANSIRSMGEGRIPTTGDQDRFNTLRAQLRQLRKLQTVELPDDLDPRTVVEHERLYRSMQRIKYEQRRKDVLDAMGIPIPSEISLPGDTPSGDSKWKTAGLSHGNVTFRNTWLRPDGEVALDNWNLASVRHKLWDYVTTFWNPWAPDDLGEVTDIVEADIREQYRESGVVEFRRLRAIACLYSLYSDSNSFVEKIRLDPDQAEILTKRFYSDYLTLFRYAETTGRWPSRGAQPLTYRQVYDLMRHAANPGHPRPVLPGTDLDAAGAIGLAGQARAAWRPDLSAVPSIPKLLTEHLREDELLPKLSGLQQQYGPDLELVLSRVEYLRPDPGQFDDRADRSADEPIGVSGVRIRGVFVTRREGLAEVGDLDLSVEWDEHGGMTARIDNLWIEPWHDRTGRSNNVLPVLLDYLRTNGVDRVVVAVQGRRGAKTALRHRLAWDHEAAADPARFAECMRGLSMYICARLIMRPDLEITAWLQQLLDELESPTSGRYPTLAEIAGHLPKGVDAADFFADFFADFHWQGVAVL